MLYYLVTITKREYGDAYLRYFYENGVHSLTAALCEGTAQQKTLDRLGIEKTEKIMLSAVVSGPLASGLLKGLMRTMQIDVPGNGIAFTVPLQSVANSASLQYLTQGQNTEQNGVLVMEENRFSLVVVIAHKGNTELVMDAARGADAGGGTIIHAKGIGRKKRHALFRDVHRFGTGSDLHRLEAGERKKHHPRHHGKGRLQAGPGRRGLFPAGQPGGWPAQSD